MPVLNYIDGYQGTLRVGATEYSVESWSATFSGTMTEVTASKNGGWTVHRRGFQKLTGEATVVYESNVATLTGAGPVPGNTVAMTLVVNSTVNITGNFVIGDAAVNWDPNGPLKISLTFGNAENLTSTILG
jgi:hypothetical protein